MVTLFKIINSILYAIVLVGMSLVFMRICWGVWLSVSDVQTFVRLPLNQSPGPATIIALGIVFYVLLIAKSTNFFMERIKDSYIYKKLFSGSIRRGL